MRLFLALPELRPGFTADDAERVRAHLAAQPNLPLSLRGIELFPLAHAGGAVALQAAARAVAQGEHWCLVGGVDSYVGLGLTQAVEAACARLPAGYRVHDIVCDLNGERYRAQEWGFPSLRVADAFDDPLSFRAPAGSFGDMGAASIPLFTILACQAAARRYAPGPHALLLASSEAGRRGAVLLQVPFAPEVD